MRLPLLPLSCLVLAFGLGATASDTFASTPPASPVSRPRVLLLPPTDTTPESGNMGAARGAAIRHRLQFEFLGRGFAVGGERVAEQSSRAEPALTLSGTGPKSAEMLDELGRRAGVDWVVNVVVESASAEPGRETDFEVATRIHLQVRDAVAHTWLHNGPYTVRVAGAGSPVMVFLRSLDAATRESVAAMLADHPPQIALAGENSLVDYLADADGLATAGSLALATQAGSDNAAP